MKRDSDAAASILLTAERGEEEDEDDAHHSPRGRDGRQKDHLTQFLRPFLALFGDDPRPLPPPHKAFLVILAFLLIVLLASFPSIWNHLNAPYLCTKVGIALQCPRPKEKPSLWENPYSATISWKACAEHRDNEISGLHPENQTTGYILIQAEGGLNQQRIAICNAVAVAKIMNATLIFPLLKQDQIWKDQTKFEDIFDVDHFINYLKDDVRIVREIPEWFSEKTELFTSIRHSVPCFFQSKLLQHSGISKVARCC